ncbi:MAG: vanadium-dependent haloperoxidase, partial [Betaproteobacteria bacterium]
EWLDDLPQPIGHQRLADPFPHRQGNADQLSGHPRETSSKSLPHVRTGEVAGAAYRALLRALDGGDPELFEQIPLGTASSIPLTNPQAGLAFDLEGPDAQAVSVPPAPRIDSRENAAEMAELYWMALMRDVPFARYGTEAIAADAAAHLTSFGPDFRGPKEGTPEAVTPRTLFRGVTRGDLQGPYVSQFLLMGNADRALGLTPQDGFVRYGAQVIDQRIRRAVPDKDYLTRYEAPPPAPPSALQPPNWLAAQNGADYRNTDVISPDRGFISTLRNLTTFVHFDALYQAYLNACLILLSLSPPTPFDQGNPYIDSRTQDGFGTFGSPHVLTLVTEVATRALKAVWYQKWGVHRRLRPEEFGGRIHVHLSGLPARPGHPAVPPGRFSQIHPDILDTSPGSLLDRVRAANRDKRGDDTYLLPLVFPEGAPTHPAYGAGHATVAGACVTILKAFFDESRVLPDVFVPDDSGEHLQPDPSSPRLTVGGELDKLAANIAIARNGAGVHWRSDYTQSVLLGEQIAIGILEEQRLTYNEDHHFTLTRFDGTGTVI